MFVKNKKPSLSAKTSQHIYHFIFPALSLLCFFAIVLWLSGGDISRNNYWTTQLEWFDQISQTLSQWRVFFKNVTQLGDALILLPIISFLVIWRPQVWAGFFGAIPLGVLL